MLPILVTGAAGFIGFHVSQRLLQEGYSVIGIDNVNSYYDPNLKEARISKLQENKNFVFKKIELADNTAVQKLFKEHIFEKVIHLAAQAGVRYSLKNPYVYMESNIIGFLNILEACRAQKIKHLVYASSSSVYGANTKLPFSEKDNVDHPVALYAASKKANELMAHSYASLYALPCSGLRFFTVYGPWGRPDMSLFQFTKNMLENKPIDVYNDGNMLRDFTYIDDIVEGIYRIMQKPAEPNSQWSSAHPDPATSYAPYRIYNIGRGQPENLLDAIHILERKLNVQAKINFLPMQPGDVKETAADISLLQKDFGYQPKISIEEGISRFVDWYQDYCKKRSIK